MVKLALRKNDKRLSARLIQFWTASIYSHCELVVDGWCYSSSVMDKGVRRKRVGPGADEISLGEDHWDLIELPWADAAAIVRYFEATDSDVYGWPSLIASQVFNRNRPTQHAAFCSEWCMRALALPNPSIYNPQTAGAQCRWLTESWAMRLAA